jgi:hypothetical protein
MRRELTVALVLSVGATLVGAQGSAQTVGDHARPGDDGQLSATLVGDLVAGGTGRLAARWDGPTGALLDAWVDLDGNGRPGPVELVAAGRPLAPGIEVVTFDVAPHVQVVPEPKVWVSARTGPEPVPETMTHGAAAVTSTVNCAWDTRFTVPDVDDEVHAMTVFDDGSGPALYVGGSFVAASGVLVNRIARWNGIEWSALTGPSGTGVNGTVYALTVFDDGSGPALFAGGDFTTAGGLTANRVARWDESGWSALDSQSGTGVNRTVYVFTAFDDGSGPALYAGGSFAIAGGLTVNHIARWDGSTWSALSGPSGTGVGENTSATVLSLGVFDDGSGPALFAGGRFETAGGVTVNHVARWDGSTWSALSGPSATGVGGFTYPSDYPSVSALTVFDDGTGPALYAGGLFTTAGGVTVNRVARWDGSAWSALSGPSGTGVNANNVTSMAVHDDGSGPTLYVSGRFWMAGGLSAEGIARWDGSSWSALEGTELALFAYVLAEFDDGSGAALYAGGFLRNAGGEIVNNIARWDGTKWSALSGQSGWGANRYVYAFAFFDHDSSTTLVAGGTFTTAGGVTVNRIASWDGGSWTALGDGFASAGWPNVSCLLPFDAGFGPDLIAGGYFPTTGGVGVNSIARWDGSSWWPLSGPSGTGVAAEGEIGTVSDLAVYDDGSGPALYVGGLFTTAGGLTANGIARWDGNSWSTLDGPSGTGVDDGSLSAYVAALAVYDDGTGPALYAGGRFTTAGGVTVNHIARWDGSSWSPLAGPSRTGMSSEVFALAVFDDGTGPTLHAGGRFTTAGGVTVNHIARWDGTSWSSLTGPNGTGLIGIVKALTVFDNGSGPALYAGGGVSTAGGVTVNNIARWDGSAWSGVTTPTGTGTNNSVNAFTTTYDASGGVLYVGGEFTTAGGIPSSRIAALRCSDITAPSDPASLSSTSHTPGIWSTTSVIGVEWSGATDVGGSGLAGYSVVFDSEPATVPDETLEVPHTTGPFLYSSAALTDGGSYFFHLRTCDRAGNCSAGTHLGPFKIDTTPPATVSSLTSSSHPVGVPTANATVDLTWTDAADATSGVAGYGVELSTSPSWSCDQAQDTTATGYTTPPLADGAWYAHVCAMDAAGNWGDVATGGHFVIDTTAPAVVAAGSEGGTADGVLSNDESVLAAVTQLWIGFSEPIDPVAVDRGIADPSHYRLVNLGPDGVLSTPSCDGPPAGDDQDIALAGAWAWIGDDTVSIQIDRDTGLAAGRYALVVCDVEDVPGNPMAAPWVRPFTVSAENLLHNPSFDYAGEWDTMSPNAQDIRFLSQDASSETSGMVVVDPVAGADELFELTQCLDVVEGTPYALGGLALVDSPLATAPTLTAVVRFYANVGCLRLVETTEAVLAVGTTHWHWTPRLLLGARAPEGALSARVGFVVTGGAADHFSVYLDEAAFFVDVLFVDGFETGDPGWWMAASP